MDEIDPLIVKCYACGREHDVDADSWEKAYPMDWVATESQPFCKNPLCLPYYDPPEPCHKDDPAFHRMREEDF